MDTKPSIAIRQYFTKSSSFEIITYDEIEAVMNKINHRPRKTLNFKTPHSVFFADSLQEAALMGFCLTVFSMNGGQMN